MPSPQYKTSVILFAGVPFGIDCQHSLRPSARSIKLKWLKDNYDFTAIYNNLMFIKMNTKTDVATLRLSVEDAKAYAFNYCYVDDGKSGGYFAYITGCQYINDGATAETSIYEYEIQKDLIMTFLSYDSQLQPAPIVRHHSGSGSFNNLRIAENIAIGSYVSNDFKTHDHIDTNGALVAIIKNATDATDRGNVIGGIPQGGEIHAFNLTTAEQLYKDFLNNIQNPQDIISIYTIPKFLTRSNAETLQYILVRDDTFDTSAKLWTPYAADPGALEMLDGYTPKNAKLLYYPFNFCKLFNDIGESIDLRIEDWPGQELAIEGTPLMPVTVRAYPKNYAGISGTEAQADPVPTTESFQRDGSLQVSLSNYPLGSWNVDSFQSYIAQNGKALNWGILGKAAGVGYNIYNTPSEDRKKALIGEGAAAISFAFSTASSLQAAKDATDRIGGNIANGNIDYSNLHKRFRISHMSIRREFAQYIDSYFTRYGYAQGAIVAKPDPTVRPYFVYIQTAGDCFSVNGVDRSTDAGFCNASEVAKINSIFENGITLWSPLRTTRDNIFKYETLENEPPAVLLEEDDQA